MLAADGSEDLTKKCCYSKSVTAATALSTATAAVVWCCAVVSLLLVVKVDTLLTLIPELCNYQNMQTLYFMVRMRN